MKGIDWRRLERAVARTMAHCGWRDVAIIGRAGDQGGDIIAVRADPSSGKKKAWVVQVKAVKGGSYIGVPALNEVMKAHSVYSADVAVVATNGDFTKSAFRRRDELVKANFDVRLWNGAFLKQLLSKWPSFHNGRRSLRPYQERIAAKAVALFDNGGKRAQYVVATGLGKTVIAADIARRLQEKGCKKFLVLCHAQDLALQLEQGFWSQLDKYTPTRVFFDGAPPLPREGFDFGLYQTTQGYLSSLTAETYDVVIVDEAHHSLAHGFRSCIEKLSPKFLIGMTATPWRGDGHSIDGIFGEPIDRVSLVDGMALGYLSQVDYRLLCDNLNWEEVKSLSKKNLTIRDLNKRLFLPQRDDAVVSQIKEACESLPNPRLAIFSPSIDHAYRFAHRLSVEGIPCLSLSGVDRVERRRRLTDFSAGRLMAVTAVDVMNEGIDVPDVNILVFMRATHSRRIFIQQLGRGLRLAPYKEKVIVLDFVSDIRRMAEVVNLDREAREKGAKQEQVYLKNGIVKFSDRNAEKFVDAWLRDVADLSESEDTEKLKFPEDW